MSIFDHAAFSRGSFSARAQSIETRVRVGPVVRFSPSFYQVVKRNVDVVVSLIALIVLSLPAAVIAVLIAWKCQGPVLSTQTMVGRNGVLFTLFTFRSVSAPAVGMSEIKPDPGGWRPPRHRPERIIPQFFNVLRGDMSLVGPRPVDQSRHTILAAQIPGSTHRLSMRPGMTGLAHINGASTLSPTEELAYDHTYITTPTLHTDTTSSPTHTHPHTHQVATSFGRDTLREGHTRCRDGPLDWQSISLELKANEGQNLDCACGDLF